MSPSFSATATGTNVNLTLVGIIQIAAADMGSNGVIYLGARLNDLWYFQNASGGWVSWTGGTIPTYYSGPLVDRTVSIVQDFDVRSLLGIQVYVGYGRDELDLVQNHKYSAVYTVR